MVRLRSPAPVLKYGGIPERPKGADCKSVVTDFAGPNPASPTKQKYRPLRSVFLFGWEAVRQQRGEADAVPHTADIHLIQRHSASAVSRVTRSSSFPFLPFGTFFTKLSPRSDIQLQYRPLRSVFCSNRRLRYFFKKRKP